MRVLPASASSSGSAVAAAGAASVAGAAGASVTRVRLDSTLRRAPSGAPPLPLLDPGGPDVCLGACSDTLAEPVRPAAHTLFGPRGACLESERGPLWVCDSGHHRLLGWRELPQEDAQPADWLLGQPAFDGEARNAGGAVSANTLNLPTGVARCGSRGLVLADAWNHRVLIWSAAPRASQQPPDVVLGQAGFDAGQSNRGAAEPAADTLFWPFGVCRDGERLWVADSGNRRVLMWQGLPERHGQPADLVLGQRDFIHRDENGGGAAGAASLRWPHALALWQGRLCVADAGNNRVMVWNRPPAHDNAACDHLLGQPDAHQAEHNQAMYWPSARSLNMPYGLAVAGAHDEWLLVADTANSRLLGWHIDDLATGSAARALAAQPSFDTKGDNRWSAAQRDSLCWPYGLAVGGSRVVVADSGNNRVLLWRLAAGRPNAPSR